MAFEDAPASVVSWSNAALHFGHASFLAAVEMMRGTELYYNHRTENLVNSTCGCVHIVSIIIIIIRTENKAKRTYHVIQANSNNRNYYYLLSDQLRPRLQTQIPQCPLWSCNSSKQATFTFVCCYLLF